MQNDWYKCWFDSPYYHMLYSDRDEVEATSFIKHLCDKLPLHKGDKVWDMACGNGRHAQALAQQELVVTGTDLSNKSIEMANKRNLDQAEFYIHDMRSPFRSNYFHAVLNLFTSFGYFERPQDDLKIFQNAYISLLPGGLFVLDYFNASKVKSKPDEKIVLVRNNIEFHVYKHIGTEHVSKTIKFEHGGKEFEFCEKVALFGSEELIQMAKACDLTLMNHYGNYLLDEFDEQTSDRSILIFKK